MATYYALPGSTENKTLSDPTWAPWNILTSRSVNLTLTEKGKKEAKLLGLKLAGYHPKKIYCSNELNSLQTAEIIAETIGLSKDNICVDERLCAKDYGILAKKEIKYKHILDFSSLKPWMTKEEKSLVKTYFRNPKKVEAETDEEFANRVNSFIDDNKDDFDDSLIIADYSCFEVIEKQYQTKSPGNNYLGSEDVAAIRFNKPKEVTKTNNRRRN